MSSSSRPRTRASVVLSAVVGVSMTAPVWAAFNPQDLVGHAIALSDRTDQYGPGVAAFGDNTFGQFSIPQINNTGQVAFGAGYNPGFSGNFFVMGAGDGVWRHTPGTGLQVMARTVSGGAGSTAGNFSILNNPLMSSDGSVYLQGFTNNSREGFWRVAGAASPTPTPVPLAQVGTTDTTAPSIPGTTYVANSLSSNGTNLLARANQAAFKAELTTGGAVTFNNDSLLVKSAGGAQGVKLAREDEATPAPVASNKWFQNFVPGAVNASGDVAFLASYNVGQFGTSVWARYRASTDSIQMIAIAGQSGALGPGSGSPAATFFSGAGNIAMNDAGDMVFMGRSDSSGNPTYLSYRGANDAANTLLAKGSNPIVNSFPSGVGNGDTMNLPNGRRLNRFSSTESPILAGDGSIFVTGQITGGVAGARALWKYAPTTGFVPVLLTDDATTTAAVLGAGVRAGDIYSLAANAQGNLAFYANLAGTGITSTNDMAILAYSENALSVVVREGMLFDADPTAAVQLKTISDIATQAQLLSTGGQDGRRTYFNDLNQLAVTLRFTDGSQGVYVLTIPEPSALALLAPAGLLLTRRRK